MDPKIPSQSDMLAAADTVKRQPDAIYDGLRSDVPYHEALAEAFSERHLPYLQPRGSLVGPGDQVRVQAVIEFRLEGKGTNHAEALDDLERSYHAAIRVLTGVDDG